MGRNSSRNLPIKTGELNLATFQNSPLNFLLEKGQSSTKMWGEQEEWRQDGKGQDNHTQVTQVTYSHTHNHTHTQVTHIHTQVTYSHTQVTHSHTKVTYQQCTNVGGQVSIVMQLTMRADIKLIQETNKTTKKQKAHKRESHTPHMGILGMGIAACLGVVLGMFGCLLKKEKRKLSKAPYEWSKQAGQLYVNLKARVRLGLTRKARSTVLCVKKGKGGESQRIGKARKEKRRVMETRKMGSNREGAQKRDSQHPKPKEKENLKKRHLPKADVGKESTHKNSPFVTTATQVRQVRNRKRQKGKVEIKIIFNKGMSQITDSSIRFISDKRKKKKTEKQCKRKSQWAEIWKHSKLYSGKIEKEMKLIDWEEMMEQYIKVWEEEREEEETEIKVKQKIWEKMAQWLKGGGRRPERACRNAGTQERRNAQERTGTHRKKLKI